MEKNIKHIVITGIFTILGVILGAAITGYIQYSIHKNELNNSRFLLTGKSAQIERQEKFDLVNDYLEALFIYLSELEKDNSKENLKKAVRDVHLKGYKIIIYSNDELSENTMKLTELIKVYDKNKRDYKKILNKISEKLGSWVFSARNELNSYKHYSLPKKTNDEFKTKILKYFLEGINEFNNE